MKALIYRFDEVCTTVIHSWPTWLNLFFVTITTLGGPAVAILISFFIIWYGYAKENLRLSLSGTSIWATLLTGSLLKFFIGRNRPDTDYAAKMIFQTDSFPSGHTSGAMIAYGLLAYLAWNLLPQPWNYVVAALLAVFIILVGISRVYLGAHYPSDIVAGWLLGAVFLAMVIIWNPLR